MKKLYLLSNSHYLFILLFYTHTTLYAQSIVDIDRYRNRAEKQYSQGNYNLAYTNYLNAYRLAARLDFVRAANLAVDISSIYHMQDDYRRGATICHEGIALLRQAPSQPDSVWFKLNSSLGEMYKKLNIQDSCYLYFSRANTILQQHPELESRIAEYVIYHYNNQGMMYVRNNAYTEGLGYLSKALSITEKQDGAKEDIAILQNNLGGLYERLGQFQKAFDFRKLASSNYKKKDDYACKIYNGLAGDAFQLKAYEETTLYANAAFTLTRLIARTAPTPSTHRSAKIALNWLGKCASVKRQPAQAEAYFKSALQYAGEKGDIVADSYLGLAKLRHRQQQIDNALFFCQQAIIASSTNFTAVNIKKNPSPAQTLSEQSLFTALSFKAELFLERFKVSKETIDLHNANEAYERAITVADAMRKSYNILETKWFFANQVRTTYCRAFETAYLLYSHTQGSVEKERVFRLMERSKAATLTDVARELQIKPGNVPADLLAKEQKLQRIITAEKLEATSEPSPALIDAQIQLAQLQQKFEKEFPIYYQAKYQPQPLQIQKVQASLDSRMAYLSYLMIQETLYIAVLTHDNLAIVRKSGDLTPLARALKRLDTALYTNPGLGKYAGTSAAITGYQWLIEPIIHLLPNRNRLLISQDGELHRLPFDILETGRVVDDFLFKQYAISYVPSAHSLVNERQDLAVKQKPSLLGLAPFIEPINTNDQLPLAYLPASEREVEQLPGESLLGKAATKGRFMHSYTNYDVLHLATHAYADNTEPARSFIAFYPNEGPDKLYAGEIYNLLLPRTRLVTLSACETGNGKLQPGEGIISLAQAFAYAGCPSVVSTLWKANDESTAYLAQQFYKHLQTGLPIDVALQRMRLDYFQSDLYLKSGHPHYWANLILIGANQPVYESPWLTGILSWRLLAFITCLIGVWAVRKRHKNRWQWPGRLQDQIGH